MKAGLYDVLRGRYYNGLKVNDVPTRTQRLQSVMSNLNRMFNTRQGSIEHLPDYGLPDVSAIYHDTPFAVDGLRQAVKEIVGKYEPRLKKIYVEHRSTDDAEMRLTFIITAEVEPGQRVKFQTTFASNNLVQVSPWTRRE